jgi:hypothetical protein
MKIQDTTNTIEQIGNITDTASFKMKSSRKAFQILSDLYSDKPMAIIRELGCNASDSHVAAGQTKPFHIHLPNTLEPWLTIQDFGTGISHQNIYNIYSTYFESTKTNTNDQIGCLGLGSKSPFCYTDNFTITSIHQGEKRIYNAYFAENGNPTISLMSCENTTDHNGIAIQIPIKSSDYTLFISAVKKAFRFFKNKPSISGGKVDWDKEVPMFEGEGWQSYDGFGWGDCYAIMGGVTYPIETTKLKYEYHDMARKGGLVLYFNMGEVDFTPSRESLSYCDDTIKALNDKMKFVVEDFQKRLSDMISEKKTIYEACKMVYSLQHQFAYIKGMSTQNLLWNGINISDPQDFVHKIIKGKDHKHNCTTYYKPSYYKQKISESTSPQMGKDTIWYHEDVRLPRSGETRVRSWVRNNPDQKITLFTEEGKDRLIEAGFPESCFVSVATLPKPISKARAKRIASGQSVTRVRGQFNIYTMGDTSKNGWEGQVYEEELEPSYYIVKPKDSWDINFKVNGFQSKYNRIDSKDRLFRLMRFFGLDKDDVIMVSERNVKHLPKTCKDFITWVNANIDLTIDFDGYADAEHYNAHNFSEAKKGLVDLPDDNALKVWVNKVHDNITKYSKFTSIINMMNGYDGHKGKPSKIKTTNKALQLLANNVDKYNWEMKDIILLANNLK